MRWFVVVMMLSSTGCYAEFDIGVRTPRKDPCTGRIENKYVYVMPDCRYAPAQLQK